MVKIAIISDIHLKLRRHKEFERSRFRQLVDALKASDANIIIIDGDLINHAIPTLDEIREVDQALLNLRSTAKVYLMDGNHEAVTKDSSTYDYIHFIGADYIGGYRRLQIEGVSIDLCSWSYIKKIRELDSAQILISHYRSAMPGLYEAEVDTSFISNYQQVILGDIHTRYAPEDNVQYVGPPYSIHFTKAADEDFGYMMLTIDGSMYHTEFVNLDLPDKVRKDMTVSEFRKFIPNMNNLYTIHLSGTLDELRGVTGCANVLLKKFVTIVEDQTITQDKSDLNDKPFMDRLSDIVSTQLEAVGDKKTLTHSILLTLQGDS